MASVPLRTIAGLHESLIDYANRVHDLRSPGDVLNELHDITKKASLSVLGAARFPPKAAGWDSLRPGSSVFLHKGAPKRGGGKNIKHWRAASSAPSCSWRSPAWLPTHGLRRNRWWNRSGLIGGQRSCSSNTEFATHCLVPSPAGGSSYSGHAKIFPRCLNDKHATWSSPQRPSRHCVWSN